ncbi:MAG: DUF427 domain-containing protein [Halioglobus sp.]
MWKYTGLQRPSFADEPGPEQESVWDYPRPPALVVNDALVEVWSGESRLARSSACLRVLETASPPTYYVPPQAVDWALLVRITGSSHCEWKGLATYWALASDLGAGAVAWSYGSPNERFAAIDGYVSFYPARLDCRVNSEQVKPQPGGFYGGWITQSLAGPFKGEPGTGHW